MVQTRRKKILFRLLAIAIGLMPLVACELGLRLAGWQPANEIQDPYVGFSEVRPLFEKNSDGNRYEIPAWRQVLFRPESFDVEKPSDEFRIFCLGGSTVQGRPFGIETSFTSWLEISLQAADDSRAWQVVNCGGVSYASYRLRPIMQELINYQPDLFIIYTGHNEFLEERTYEDFKQTPGWIIAIHDHLSALRTYSLLRSSLIANSGNAVSKPGSELPLDVEAILDYQGGLEKYHRDKKWNSNVSRHFELNLKQMVAIAKEAGVSLILFNPACRLKDCPPFKSEIASQLPGELQQQITRLEKKAKINVEQQAPDQIELLCSALAIDEGNAHLHQLLADVYYLGGDMERAKEQYLLAKDNDVCPLRILEPMRDSIFKVARQQDLPMVDAQSHFEAISPDGITGPEFFLDHVHPTIFGHQVIAQLLVLEMQKMGLVSPRDGWEELRNQKYTGHLSGIDHLYFELGKQRLEGLQRWTQGKVRRLKNDDEG